MGRVSEGGREGNKLVGRVQEERRYREVEFGR